MSKIKLYYYDFRGRAEIIRLVLTLTGQDFEDIRFSREDWPEYKPQAPFGQAPYIEYKGKKYGQSKAIAAFFANEFGVYGKSNLERLRVDEITGLCEDLLQIIIKTIQVQDEAKKAELDKKLVAEDIPKFCAIFARLLRENAPRGVFVGRELTIADLYVYDVLYTVHKNRNYDAFATFPELQALKDKVESNPRLKVYLANRKETPY